ncbi:MAG: amino acid ABC transporter substrate-binding protein [Anaerolineaceae bacterium]|jgi:polar amino acid transport system substrate-binding protein|nr:L-cystine-binding protein FliY [Anaerolineales bacterium]MCC7511089.1 transporter substrate-binding domain-containing protein [Anaerolineae bacterium]GER79738.1 amino acid ABC transporter substrate-binding protein [Candidatus Denitrolinea symbiosum]GIK09705.1 MAG: amino acid ABC transporter substrate-binding protein [Chloroflexota bacterium]GJQ39892.1 MAG: amino acid ABC transporter substrate-binding protein [Anaerolineaceae bacterium]
MKKLFVLLSLLVIASLALTACGSSQGGDLLSQIKKRGYVVASTDPNYMPQSGLKTDGKRPANTKCPSDLLTYDEMEGFDVDTAYEVAKRLGVEICYATPDWDVVTAGSWADKWDMSVGSMTVKPPRPDHLWFTTPYYAPTAVIAVPTDSTIASIADLAGQSICVATATTYLDWLNNALDLNPADIYAKPPEGIKIVELSTDQECPQALAAGRKEFVAYATSITVVEANVAAGLPVKQLGDPVFKEPNAIAIDKASSFDTAAFLKAVDDAVKAMHADGTLSKLSIQWYGSDLTQGLVK